MIFVVIRNTHLGNRSLSQAFQWAAVLGRPCRHMARGRVHHLRCWAPVDPVGAETLQVGGWWDIMLSISVPYDYHIFTLGWLELGYDYLYDYHMITLWLHSFLDDDIPNWMETWKMFQTTHQITIWSPYDYHMIPIGWLEWDNKLDKIISWDMIIIWLPYHYPVTG